MRVPEGAWHLLPTRPDVGDLGQEDGSAGDVGA
jgi:hypothetical protein